VSPVVSLSQCVCLSHLCLPQCFVSIFSVSLYFVSLSICVSPSQLCLCEFLSVCDSQCVCVSLLAHHGPRMNVNPIE